MTEKKVMVSILGEDKPGIVYTVSKTLYELSCNILELSQTILQTEFAGIFLVSMPQSLEPEGLEKRLNEVMEPMRLSAWVKDFRAPVEMTSVSSEPFVITLHGQDRLDIIPEITGIIAGFDVNIENLKAIAQQDDPSQVVIAFEVAVPLEVHRPAFREALRFKAEELETEISLQHRDIFEAIHRI